MSKPHHIRSLLIGSFLFAAAMFMFSGKSSAATFNVATGDDIFAVDGSCSLSEALDNISTQSAVNVDCPAGDGINETIMLPAGTITLQSNLTPITHDITIQGQGMGQSIIDGNSGQYQPFSINSPATNMNISGLTFIAFRDSAIAAADVNLTMSQVEIDGTLPISPAAMAGINVYNNTGTPTTVDISDSYIHDLHVASGANLSLGAFGVLISANSSADITANIRRVTISDISNDGNAVGIEIAGGFGFFPGGTGRTIAAIDNVTVDNISSTSQLAAGIAIVNAATSVSTSTSSSVRNSTVANVSSQTGLAGDGGGIFVAGGCLLAGVTSMVNMDVSNVLLFNNTSHGVPADCQTGDLTAAFGGVGSTVTTFSSYGGNVVGDGSCGSYFIDPTDQNSTAGLAALVSALSDNGGFVPTMALIDGSAAIDSGVVAAGLNDDARGQARPQGAGFDAGAYEFVPAVVNPPVDPPVDPTPPATSSPTDGSQSLASSGQPVIVSLGLATGVVFALGLIASLRRRSQALSRR